MKYKLIAITVGVGAGSKYLHTLLDNHPEMYGIPGYCLMYFYRHYDDAIKSAKTIRALVDELLTRMPPLYDTRTIPGSETLNQLGRDGNEYLSVNKEKYINAVIEYLNPSQTLEQISSRSVLLAIHQAHFKFFKSNAYNEEMPSTILYHIHDDLLLPRLYKDFPETILLTTYRNPSINLGRRINSSILEANSVKLDALDYELLRPIVGSLMPYFHYNALKIHKSYPNTVLYVDYDKLVENELGQVNKIMDEIGIALIEPNEFGPTFAGKEHRLRFYEKRRNRTIDQIKTESTAKAKNTKKTLLDNVYEQIIRNNTRYHINRKEYIQERLKLEDYEKEQFKFIQNCAKAKNYLALIYKSLTEKPMSYPEKHGFYIYKWCTPQVFIWFSMYLRNKVIISNGLSNRCWRLTRIVFYLSCYPVSIVLMLTTPIKARLYQIKMLKLIKISANMKLIE